MAISHIGRVFRERTEQERLKIAFDLLEGKIGAESEALTNWYKGYNAGLKWAIATIEEIESERGV